MSTRCHVRFLGGSAIGLVGLVCGLALSPSGDGNRTMVGVSGGDRFIFRVYDDDSVDFLDLESAKTVGGIADWTKVVIDTGRHSRRHPARWFSVLVLWRNAARFGLRAELGAAIGHL